MTETATTSMRVSVVMPMHNAEPWVADALRSVAEQTLTPHEIIVVDDASTDASVERVRDTGIDVTLLHVTHGNAAAARNAGIEIATGDWIAFQDADDVWYHDHLQRAAAPLCDSNASSGGDVAFQAFGDDWFEDRGVVHRPNPWPITEPTRGLPAERFLELFRQHLMFYMPSVVVRRDVLVERGMLDPALPRRHDMDMWLRVTQGGTWAYDPRPHVRCRMDTPGSVSRTNRASSEYWHLKMLLRHREAYDGDAMRWLIHRGARATLATALTDGGSADRKLAYEFAWPLLPARHRLLFAAARACPPAFALANRLRRRHHASERARRAQAET